MDNPFALLQQQTSSQKDQNQINERFERILLTTVRSNDSKFVYVSALPGDNALISSETVSQVVFERLMQDSGGHQKGLFFYLFESYVRAREELANFDAKSYMKCIEALTLNGATVLLTPDLISNGNEQSFSRQLVTLSNENFAAFKVELVEFFCIIITSVEEQSSPETCLELLQRLARFIGVRLKKKPGDFGSIASLCVLANSGQAARAIVSVSTPQQNDPRKARFFEESLIGTLLSSGALSDPDVSNGFFVNPRRLTASDLNMANQQLWSLTSRMTAFCYDLFYAALKSSEEAKQDLVKWLSHAIQTNRAGRNVGFDDGISQVAFFGREYGKCSDGFLVNLLSIFAKLARPFSKPWDSRFISISPDYRNGFIDFSSETKMVPATSDQLTPQTGGAIPFRADLFYLTHACMAAGYRRVVERFLHAAQDLQRSTDTHEAVESGRMQLGPQEFELLGTRIEMQTRSYLTIRACLFEPNLCQDLVAFLTSTTSWLVAQCLGISSQSELKLDLIISKTRSPAVSLIPELIFENVVEIFLFWKRFHVGINQEIMLHLRENAEHVLSFMLAFEGSRERLNNPHLRAKLADLLEAFVVPPPLPQPGVMSSYESHGFDLSTASNQHPLAAGIIPVVISVFVGIEVTGLGQGANFYSKFSYRRPIYAIIQHCCSLDLHKIQLSLLADAAVAQYDVVSSDEPPLFLRFVNLLINDAIYLLDEALGTLVKIKHQQDEKNSGEWDRLPLLQRQRKVQEYDFMVQQCRALNVLGTDTIRALSLITSLVPNFFTHFSLDDRIAAMANYFLLHLVGPKQRDFKVENLIEVDFKPEVLVHSISSIYVNLGHLEQFRVAVVSDGRSFSEDLFTRASRVLARIRVNSDEIDKFDEASRLIIATTKQVEDETKIEEGAPDEFLDPILGTLMHDPVMLPSSKVVVDRPVIMRHLLSDQMDPFNREPLSVDQLIPMPELKEKVENWLQERRQQKQKDSE